MNKLLQLGSIIIAVISIGIADVFIKKIAESTENFGEALKHPLILAVVALYVVQILIFTFVFVKKAELSIVGIVQTALYAIIVIGSGILFFNESLTWLQGIGIGLAIVGVVLMNL